MYWLIRLVAAMEKPIPKLIMKNIMGQVNWMAATSLPPMRLTK